MESITSRQNPLFQHIRKLRTSGSYRRKFGEFLGEGPKLLEEAIKWGAEIRTVVTADGREFPKGFRGRVVMTPADVLETLADTETPQGVVFVCALPDTALPQRLEPGRYLILDGVQDPGNLGTIWRTADALGAAGLLLAGACADPYSPKTVRSTMGACFRSLPVWRGEPEKIGGLLERAGIPLYATALREDTSDLRDVDLSRAAVVIGSEGKGISEEMLSLCQKSLKIPMEARCESLNAAVAAAVVLWEGRRGVR